MWVDLPFAWQLAAVALAALLVFLIGLFVLDVVSEIGRSSWRNNDDKE